MADGADHLPRPRCGPDRARAPRPARPRATRPARRSRSSPARSPRPDGLDRPYLVFLQGGPGFEATRPTSPPTGWMKRALQDYRVLLLDQRGTGPIDPGRPVIPATRREAQAEYLTHFRADAIVRDAELIRSELGVDRWSVLGQSFGGFTSMTYLSIAPRGPARGVHHRRPVADRPAGRRRLRRDLTSARLRKNRRYFERYPDDRRTGPRDPAAARRRGRPAAHRRPADLAPVPPARHVARRQRRLRAAPPRARAAVRLAGVPARRRGRRRAFGRNPIYATLHESSYADGVADALVGAPRCCPTRSSAEGCSPREHVFPWMWEDYAALRRTSARPPSCWPSTRGRGCTTPTGWRATRSRSRRRSTSTTCTSSGRSPRRRPARSAACGRGSPTSTSTTACAPTASASSAGSIDLVQGRA